MNPKGICPYDDTPCSDLESELKAYSEFVRSLAQNNVNRTFIQGSGNKCPRNCDCIRYQRYLNIVKKVKAAQQKQR